MRLIKMTGGLGNQMFIYAMYLKMKTIFPDVRIDLSDMVHYQVHYGYEMNKVFHLPRTEFCINRSLKKIIEFLLFKTILERKQGGSLVPYTRKYHWPWIYFKGFYQSEKYFAGIEKEVREAFVFDIRRASRRSLRAMQEIKADPHAVSIHVRRGDYLLEKHWKALGCICQSSYYLNALAELEKRVKHPHYYVFSEDLNWVRQNLPLIKAEFIDWNKGEDSWQDMMLMSHCRHHIICNSTFSWWGAWLNPLPDKIVIAPERWTQTTDSADVVPESWLKVSIG
ncbi:alpha-1,2-fucosyltransferase [Paraprevotella clara]|uniref:Glycosyltransferase, family 11 n=1 Tax=Paraprevotella clara YIT 11840 TaxID=762968 RepID=G5SN80_9BACT|nr:alpha-1,2-fucosyltransferase [Paraprevotella clara]EHH01146.1 glycosyltransferase, family 11 [Paraprevotella clara YIT 11840]